MRVRTWLIAVPLVFMLTIGGIIFSILLERKGLPEMVSDLKNSLFRISELPPPPGTDRVLSYQELRYCNVEDKRLKLITERMLYFPAADHLSLAVNDYNARCAHYKYSTEQRFVIMRKIDMQYVCLVYDVAAARVDQWRRLSGSYSDPSRGYGALISGFKRLDLSKRFDVEIVQRRLSEFRVYFGAIDGVWGTESESALVTFKIQNGMGESPTWDTATQRRLFRPSDYRG